MVTAGANASVVLKNDGVGIVEGHVIDSSTRKPVTGLMCSCMGASATARTDDSGAFRIEGAPAGETSVYCVGPRASGHTDVVVAAGKTAQVEVVATARDRSRRSYSGLQLGQQLDHIVVTAVAEGSPAERAGIKVEDFLLRLDGEKVPDARTARMMLEYLAPGKSVQLTIERDDKERTVTLELAAPP
jgi:membrane-associated protease RseP (regulator of RpoE activity)